MLDPGLARARDRRGGRLKMNACSRAKAEEAGLDKCSSGDACFRTHSGRLAGAPALGRLGHSLQFDQRLQYARLSPMRNCFSYAVRSAQNVVSCKHLRWQASGTDGTASVSTQKN